MTEAICNSDSGAWLRLCADLEHEAAPPFPAAAPNIDHISQEFQLAAQELGMGPLEPDVGEDDKRESSYEPEYCVNPQTGARERAL